MEDKHLLPVCVQNVVDMQIVQLNLWNIKFNANNIKLEGFVRTEDGNSMHRVCSEYICKRMTSTLLFDISGKFYELVGQIDRNFQIKTGMPSNIIDEFLNGFPETWAYLISRCLTTEQLTARRSIQCAPPVHRTKEIAAPIVTLADDTDMSQNRKNCENEAAEKRESSQKSTEGGGSVGVGGGGGGVEISDNEADYTYRAKETDKFGAITPIRWEKKKGNGEASRNVVHVFNETPIRNISATLSTPIGKKRDEQNLKQNNNEKQFLMPDIPVFEPRERVDEQKIETDRIFGSLDGIFQEVTYSKTPNLNLTRNRPPKRFEPEEDDHYRPRKYFSPRASRHHNHSYSPRHSRRRPNSNDWEDDSPYSHSYSKLYRRKKEKGSKSSDESEEDDYHRRKRNERYYRDDSRSRSSYYEHRKERNGRKSEKNKHRNYSSSSSSSSSSKSIRRENGLNRYESDLEKIRRKEKKLENQLNRLNSKEVKNLKTNRGKNSRNDSDEIEDYQNIWNQKNQNLLDTPIDGEEGRKRRPKREEAMYSKREKKTTEKEENAPKPKRICKKLVVDANDSIASRKPRRACATPATTPAAAAATAAVKKVTWPKRDIDKLKRVIEMKKPTDAESDWTNVARLMAKAGADGNECKQAAIGRLKWKPEKEAEKNDEEDDVEEVEDVTRKRKGITAIIKEDLKLRNQMMSRRKSGGMDALEGTIESVEDVDASDVSADGSLLESVSPIAYTKAIRQKGGKRKTLIPEPVEDSPLTRSRNSSLNKTAQYEAEQKKSYEASKKYVTKLATMQQQQSRPGSRMNRTLNSTKNVSKIIGGKKKGNVSMTVEEGNERALKMIRKARGKIEEDGEEDSDEMDSILEEDEEEENVLP